MVNWGRRLLYGVTLYLGAGSAGAAAPDAPVRHSRPAPPPTGVNTTTANWLAQGYPVVLGNVPLDPMDPRAQRAGSNLLPFAANAAFNNPLLTATVTDDLTAMRNGVGIDFKMPDVGNFYLNLYTRKNPKGRGKRWQLIPDDGAEAKTWSMGGAVNVVREIDGGRHLVVAPQINVNLTRAIGAPGQMEASLQRANWSGIDPTSASSEKVVQLSFRWKF